MRRVAGAVAALLLAAGLVSCSAGNDGETPTFESRVQVDTAELRAAKRQARVADCVAGEPVRGSELPDVTLPCLGGGPEVSLASVEGPAVVTLWASWCGPCRRELPYFQRLHETGKVGVVGVDWQDTRPAAALQLLEETGARFPQLADPDALTAEHYRLPGLPAILFVARDGSVTFHVGSVKSYAELAVLVREHTGVRL